MVLWVRVCACVCACGCACVCVVDVYVCVRGGGHMYAAYDFAGFEEEVLERDGGHEGQDPGVCALQAVRAVS